MEAEKQVQEQVQENQTQQASTEQQDGLGAIRSKLEQCKDYIERAFAISFYEPNFFKLTAKLDESMVEVYKLFNEIISYETALKKQQDKDGVTETPQNETAEQKQ